VTTDEQLKIAESWLTVQRHWWACDEMNRLCHEKPMAAWAIVVRKIELTDDDELLGDIGANPLEYLIDHHGALLVDAVEAQAKSDQRLRRALSTVWLSERDSDLAKRFLVLGCQFMGKDPID
jgi:hypothetical protein